MGGEWLDLTESTSMCAYVANGAGNPDFFGVEIYMLAFAVGYHINGTD